MRSYLPGAVALVVMLVGAGCSASIPQPHFEHSGNTDRAAPLGPGYVLMPLGTDDDALLGRVLPNAPEAGRALEETAATNPCADKLGAAVTVGMRSTLEDAEELSATAKGIAALGVYGFQAQAKRATHFVYKLTTEKKASREATADYLACCKEKSCGYGVVTELVYGDGDYSAAEETRGEVAADVVNIASARGTASLTLLHKRHVHGWIAAKVMIHPENKGAETPAAKPLGAIGPSDVLLDIDSASGQVKQIYEREKVAICDVEGDWAFCDGTDKLNELQFARRYRDLLGTHEIDYLDTRRNTGLLVLDFGLLVGGVALMSAPLIGIATKDIGPGRDSTLYFVSLGVGFAAVMASTAVTLTANPFLNPGGSISDHKLTRDDAERYAAIYNRALLRKVTSDVDLSRWDTKRAASGGPVKWAPSVGVGGVGIVGTF